MLRFNCQALLSAVAILFLSACGHPATPIASSDGASVATAGGYTKEAIARVIRKELESSTTAGTVALAPEIRIERLPTKSWYKFETELYETYEPEHKIVRYHAKGICYMTTKTVKLTTLDLQQ